MLRCAIVSMDLEDVHSILLCSLCPLHSNCVSLLPFLCCLSRATYHRQKRCMDRSSHIRCIGNVFTTVMVTVSVVPLPAQDLEHFVSLVGSLMEHATHIEQQLKMEDGIDMESAEDQLKNHLPLQDMVRRAPQDAYRKGSELLRTLEKVGLLKLRRCSFPFCLELCLGFIILHLPPPFPFSTLSLLSLPPPPLPPPPLPPPPLPPPPLSPTLSSSLSSSPSPSSSPRPALPLPLPFLLLLPRNEMNQEQEQL